MRPLVLLLLHLVLLLLHLVRVSDVLYVLDVPYWGTCVIARVIARALPCWLAGPYVVMFSETRYYYYYCFRCC